MNGDSEAVQFLNLGSEYTSILDRSFLHQCRVFQNQFGVSHTVASKTWEIISSTEGNCLPENSSRQHLLFALYYLKKNATEIDAQIFFGCSNDTYRKWKSIFVQQIVNIVNVSDQFLYFYYAFIFVSFCKY